MRYVPPPQSVPEWLIDRIRRYGGVNDMGQPNFRIVWGNDRIAPVGGKWQKLDEHGTPCGYRVETQMVPKYAEGINRWILEMWQPPPMSEEEWHAHFTQNIDGIFIETLGPYPANGDYELVKVLETPCTCKGNCTDQNRHHRFVPLTATICDALIHVATVNKHIPVKDRMEYRRKQREREDAAKSQRLEDAIKGIGRPSWARNPHVVLSEMKARIQ